MAAGPFLGPSRPPGPGVELAVKHHLSGLHLHCSRMQLPGKGLDTILVGGRAQRSEVGAAWGPPSSVRVSQAPNQSKSGAWQTAAAGGFGFETRQAATAVLCDPNFCSLQLGLGAARLAEAVGQVYPRVGVECSRTSLPQPPPEESRPGATGVGTTKALLHTALPPHP